MGALISVCLHAQSLNDVQLSATPWTVAHQAPLSMGFPRQEYWIGLPFPSPKVMFPTQGLNPDLLHCRWILVYSSLIGYKGSKNTKNRLEKKKRKSLRLYFKNIVHKLFYILSLVLMYFPSLSFGFHMIYSLW